MDIRTLSIRFVFDRKGETKKDPSKKALVQIEVYEKVTHKKVYISTGVRLTKKQFSTHGGMSVKDHPNAAILKNDAHSVYNQIEAFIGTDKCQSIDDVKNWNKEEGLTLSVIDFIYSDLKRRDVSMSVLEYNNSFIKRLEDFGKIKTFKDVTYNNIEELDLYLKKYIKSPPTLYKRHSLFKGYIERARKKGLIKMNPYDDFELRKGHSEDPIFLFEEELNKIIKYKPSGPMKDRLERVRDMFLFQCFTGLAYADMAAFSRDTIIDNNGQKEIHGFRKKTNQRYDSLFLPQAEAIAEKYDYKLPIISNQKYNDYLKTLAQETSIDKPISSHAGRHTFATYLINKGVSLEAISKILGHSNMKMTQLYARLLGKTAIQEMKDKLL